MNYMHRHCFLSSLSSRPRVSGKACINSFNCIRKAHASNHPSSGSAESSHSVLINHDLSKKPKWNATPSTKTYRGKRPKQDKRYWVPSMEARKGPTVGNKTAAKGEEILEGAPVADEDEEVMTSSFSPGTFVEIRRYLNLHILFSVIGNSNMLQRR